jgi:hypothetical protein
MGRSWEVRRLWRKRATSVPEQKPEVLDGCERFLGGHLLEEFSGNEESAPDWVWISVLAHASEEDLATCGSRGVLPRPTTRCVWDRTLSFLSEMLVDHARRTGASVAEVQREIVVPIELGLRPSHPVAPSTFVRMVLSGLAEHGGSGVDQPSPTTEGRS